MARPFDPDVDEAIIEATLTLLRDRGFARMSMEAIAQAAGVGKPAIYRRYPDKAALVAALITRQLPQLEPIDLGDTKAELWQTVQDAFPDDGATYVALIGGLIAEHKRHPELIDAFRRSVLHPRRASVLATIKRGQERGDLRDDIDAEAALDLFAGPFLARVFAGVDTTSRWRKKAFEIWWYLLEAGNHDRTPRSGKARDDKRGRHDGRRRPGATDRAD
jgi:AcrR family transcriptional regulator